MKVEVLNGRNSKNEANRGGSGSGSKDLCKIKSRALRIAFGNQSSFEAFNRAISIALDLEYPSRSNNLGTNRSINNLPSPIAICAIISSVQASCHLSLSERDMACFNVLG